MFKGSNVQTKAPRIICRNTNIVRGSYRRFYLCEPEHILTFIFKTLRLGTDLTNEKKIRLCYRGQVLQAKYYKYFKTNLCRFMIRPSLTNYYTKLSWASPKQLWQTIVPSFYVKILKKSEISWKLCKNNRMRIIFANWNSASFSRKYCNEIVQGASDGTKPQNTKTVTFQQQLYYFYLTREQFLNFACMYFLYKVTWAL